MKIPITRESSGAQRAGYLRPRDVPRSLRLRRVRESSGADLLVCRTSARRVGHIRYCRGAVRNDGGEADAPSPLTSSNTLSGLNRAASTAPTSNSTTEPMNGTTQLPVRSTRYPKLEGDTSPATAKPKFIMPLAE